VLDGADKVPDLFVDVEIERRKTALEAGKA
jgi:hypothetical protein